jgi:hypothetical protein
MPPACLDDPPSLSRRKGAPHQDNGANRDRDPGEKDLAAEMKHSAISCSSNL